MTSYKQFKLFKDPDLFHGGNTRLGRRKIARPLDPKRALHLVMKSSIAVGQSSFLIAKHKKRIQKLVEEASRKYCIQVDQFVNVGNHLHLLVRFKKRQSIQNFLRVIAGKIAILITGALKGGAVGRFWDGPCFTRVVNWGKDLTNLARYFLKNDVESLGYSNSLARDLVSNGFLIFGTGS